MTSPCKLLRVLLVEDSQDDADLVLLELNEGGFDVVSKRVETEAAMRDALRGGDWDIVISDFNLPVFSARSALTVLREVDADMPFVIVSGCIGEESAVALMKEGASDFVMKDKLARLVPVIGRELQDATVRREHRHALDALRANEKLLHGITSALGEGVLVLDDRRRLIFMNPEAERLLGWTASELSGLEVHRMIHSLNQDDMPLPESGCAELGMLTGGGVYRTEDDVFWRKDGSPMPVSIATSAILEDGKAVACVVVFQDISQRKQAEWDLLESSKQLRELTTHLQTVREEERTRIARELHDELGQMLTGIKLYASWLINQLPAEQLEVASKADALYKLIDETLAAVRRTAADLRPVMLDDLGLAAAVEWLTEQFTEQTGVNIELAMGQGPWDDNLSPEVAIAAFRIVQECLTNIARHADAQQVLISLKCQDGNLLLLVSDDGRGIVAANGKKRDSYGVIGMRERAHGLGGRFDFYSVPGAGTRVEVVLPIGAVVSEELE